MSTKSETAAEVLAEMRAQDDANYEHYSQIKQWADRIERALSAQGEAVGEVNDRGSIRWYSRSIPPTGAKLYTHPAPAASDSWTPEDIQKFARAYKAEVPHAELTVHGIAFGLEALRRPAPARVTVTEEMVERFRAAYFKEAEVADGVFTASDAVRAALTAALEAGHGDVRDVVVTGWTKADGETLWMEHDGEPMFRAGRHPDSGANRAIYLVPESLSACIAVPEGFVLVPREPTDAMREAWENATFHVETEGAWQGAYADMLAAAPQPAGDDDTAGVFGWWLQDCNGVGRFIRRPSPEYLNEYRKNSGYSATPLYSSRQPEPAPSAPADVQALDWITDDMSGIQIVDQVRIQAQFSRIEDDEIVRALGVAVRRLSAPATGKEPLQVADVEALRAALEEILDYRGGASSALDDEYVVQRARDALARRLSGAQQADTLEALDESEKDIAVVQAVEFAQYVVDHAKGRMVEAADRFLALPYSQDVARRLAGVQQVKGGVP